MMEQRHKQENTPKKNQQRKTLLTVLFVAIFLYGAFNLFGIWSEYKESDRFYNGAQETFLKSTDDGSQLAAAQLDFAVDFNSLLAVNDDVAGWIWMKGTSVNYPVMHSEQSNDEYLYTTYDGKQNKSGSIFIDFRNSAGYVDDNTVLYGHNMKNGRMFAFINRMRNQEYYDKHKEFYILTPEGNRRYEVISVFQVDALSDLYTFRFDTSEEKQDWLDRVLKRSSVLAPFTTSAEDTFVMLSTCVSADDLRARLVAVGRLAEIEEVYTPPLAEEVTASVEETSEVTN